ncbi:hypothetical protein DCS_01835 [Drechmeria coniospora]|uniref:Uncharacterized protein n=1 Tax=Drechmeria coniospora TaxID=98403 RepID=A0A151GUB9_DRECN|nr:hypothetical protein DCS_01835 [Drechmeria coniospora]KYK60697.1 hypothetical protein DCS_01835 [Drechmeria coniospora]
MTADGQAATERGSKNDGRRREAPRMTADEERLQELRGSKNDGGRREAPRMTADGERLQE